MLEAKLYKIISSLKVKTMSDRPEIAKQFYQQLIEGEGYYFIDIDCFMSDRFFCLLSI
jgi:hypothetical protein